MNKMTWHKASQNALMKLHILAFNPRSAQKYFTYLKCHQIDITIKKKKILIQVM